MTFVNDVEAPARYQSEPSSAPSKAENCGVAVVAAVADFYADRRHDIEKGRSLIAGTGPYNLGSRGIVMGAPPRKCTNVLQQAEILRRLGVPCKAATFRTVADLHRIVDSGRRPIGIGLHFMHVPDAVAGHGFNGMHAIKVRTGATVNGERGFLVNDPNFWPSRPDPTDGKRFYSDTVVQAVLDRMGGTTGVVPDHAKVDAAFTEAVEMAILTRILAKPQREFDVRKGVVLRKGPGLTFPEHFTLPANDRFTLIGFDTDPITGVETGWVAATRKTKPGIFFVPPKHSP